MAAAVVMLVVVLALPRSEIVNAVPAASTVPVEPTPVERPWPLLVAADPSSYDLHLAVTANRVGYAASGPSAVWEAFKHEHELTEVFELAPLPGPPSVGLRQLMEGWDLRPGPIAARVGASDPVRTIWLTLWEQRWHQMELGQRLQALRGQGRPDRSEIIEAFDQPCDRRGLRQVLDEEEAPVLREAAAVVWLLGQQRGPSRVQEAWSVLGGDLGPHADRAAVGTLLGNAQHLAPPTDDQRAVVEAVVQAHPEVEADLAVVLAWAALAVRDVEQAEHWLARAERASARPRREGDAGPCMSPCRPAADVAVRLRAFMAMVGLVPATTDAERFAVRAQSCAPHLESAAPSTTPAFEACMRGAPPWPHGDVLVRRVD